MVLWTIASIIFNDAKWEELIHSEFSIENWNYTNELLIMYNWIWTQSPWIQLLNFNTSENQNPVDYLRDEGDNYTVIASLLKIINHGIWLQQHFELNLTQNFWNCLTLNQKYTLKWFFIHLHTDPTHSIQYFLESCWIQGFIRWRSWLKSLFPSFCQRDI